MKTKPKKETVQSQRKGIHFVKNLLLASIVSAFIFVIFRENAGYSWVWTSLISENLKFANRSAKLNDSQRMQAKFGMDAAALDYIKQNTPESAIILMPPYEILMGDSASFQFKKDLGGIKVRNWALDLLYPRKLVYFDENDKIPFANQLTHVVVMDGWGYKYLSYNVTAKSNFDVLPIVK